MSQETEMVIHSESEMDVDIEFKVGEDTTMSYRSARKAANEKIKAGSGPKNKKSVEKRLSAKIGVQKKSPMKAKDKTKDKNVDVKSALNTTSEMVEEALTNLKSRKGITLPSIRKYIATNFQMELNKLRDRAIKNCLRKQFEIGKLRNIEPSADGELKFNNRFVYKK